MCLPYMTIKTITATFCLYPTAILFLCLLQPVMTGSTEITVTSRVSVTPHMQTGEVMKSQKKVNELFLYCNPSRKKSLAYLHV